MRGAGRVLFVLFLVVGTLNIIYGIGALDNANYFADDTRFVLDNLNTLGWVLIILGVIQHRVSLMAGNTYGRVIGIVGGSLGAIKPCSRSGRATSGGRSPSSRFASTSCTESSCSARTSGSEPEGEREPDLIRGARPSAGPLSPLGRGGDPRIDQQRRADRPRPGRRGWRRACGGRSGTNK